MIVLKAIFIVLLVIISFLLIGLVLMQKSKSGGGLGGAFGGGMTESILGSRAGNFLSKATMYLGIAFAVLTLAITYIDAHFLNDTGPGFSVPAATQPAPAPAPAPGAPAGN